MYTGRSLIIFLGVFNFLICGLVVAQDGWKWRIPQSRQFPKPDEYREVESNYCNGTDILDGVQLGGRPDEPLVTCENDRGSEDTIYVWGDSHARHLVAGLSDTYPDKNVRIMYYSSCEPQVGLARYPAPHSNPNKANKRCKERNRRAIEYFQNIKPTTIILHQFFGYGNQFSDNWHNATAEIISLLEDFGHKTVIIGGVVQPDVYIPTCLAVPMTISDSQLISRCKGSQEVSRFITQNNKQLATRYPNNFIDISGYFCPNGTICKWSDDGELLFRDKHHLTVYASTQLIMQLRDEIDLKTQER